ERPSGLALDAMGGLIAGLGGSGAVTGANGSITDVSAGRIAAIFAAGATLAGPLDGTNAVFALANIQAGKALGADLDADGIFDFTNNGGTADFELGIDDPVDGLVLVRSAGFTGATVNPPPLKLITI
ncbi:MAG TPA: hypothetical protein VF593_06975, partial [Chthoniobacteraceae bacterium]